MGSFEKKTKNSSGLFFFEKKQVFLNPVTGYTNEVAVVAVL